MNDSIVFLLMSLETIEENVQNASKGEKQRQMAIEQIHKNAVSGFISMLNTIGTIILIMGIIMWIS